FIVGGPIFSDVKPSVFVIAAGQDCKKIYIVHFGLARRYRAYDRALVPQRAAVPCLGSMRYMPRRSHEHLERSRKDDLESWLYMLCEFFQPEALAWASESKNSEVYRMKEVFMSEAGGCNCHYRIFFISLNCLAHVFIVYAAGAQHCILSPRNAFEALKCLRWSL
uniref:Uncharacterized protein n=1 Tax=Parascaris univalens TaxID=6257 RepID=A0A915A7C7_PARUN